ncbi:MAG: HEPN domain-containing protein [Chloroflexi bacterium]|nr:HEPN domain-containing protein [Chloroflexota bacterium]
MKETTEEWVAKAESDYDLARLAMEARDTPIVEGVCFHSQQCVEKYLKAFLQERGVRFAPAHPLDPLLKLCLTVDEEFETLRSDLEGLDLYAVRIRYPGMSATDEMAKDGLASATGVRLFVRGKLGLAEQDSD